MISYRGLFIFLYLLNPWITSGQLGDSLSVISAKWSDSFIEWEIYPDLESNESVGQLEMRWKMQNDWSTWDFRLDESLGDISTQWPDRYDEWTIRSEGNTVTLKTRWPGDYSEWRISDDHQTYVLAVVNPNIPEEWEVKYLKEQTFQIYTEFEGDLSSWLIFQNGERLPRTTQMAMIFAVIVTISPKF